MKFAQLRIIRDDKIIPAGIEVHGKQPHLPGPRTFRAREDPFEGGRIAVPIQTEADSARHALETDASVARGVVASGELPARSACRPEGVHGSVIPEFTGSPGP